MDDKIMTDPQQLRSYIKDLRIQKKSGELDEEDKLNNQEISWRNVITYNFIESCIEHYDDEVRLEILGLLVDSKKSTLFFTEKELQLIIHFLTINLGDRLEFVPLIKRALKRIKESLAVFKRHLAQLDKLESCKHDVRENLELYEQLKNEYIHLANIAQHSISYYQQFYLKVRETCLTGIRPGSTHTRKKNSLRIIQLEEEFLANEFRDSAWTKEQAAKLFQCLLLDTYETNKEVTYKILTNINPELLQLHDETKVHEIIEVALKLGNSIRPIDSITASYMVRIGLLSPVIKTVLHRYMEIDGAIKNTDDITLHLIIIVIEQLRGPARLASENIITAAAKHSLYGYLLCIRLLLSTCNLKKQANSTLWIKTINEIITICLSLNNSVTQIVNSSSPEGHLPMDLDNKILDTDSDIAVTPQMVLLCSWRTVKEVSLLFGYLAEKSPIEGEDANAGLLSKEQIIKIGDHLVTLLCETKHRGAFEQAHVGFEQLCKRLWRLKQTSLNELPKLWLYQLLLAITGLSSGNSKLCATRRSAGVPFMVQALIVSEPTVSKKSEAQVFHSVIKILLRLTEFTDENQLFSGAKKLLEDEEFFNNVRQEEDKKSLVINHVSHSVTIAEVKTHAFNILRALFRHAQLGDLTRAYAADGLIAAIKSYDEGTWAESNAASLLYSALITRIFGVQRTKDHVNLTVHNKMTGKVFFERYPKLLPFMIEKLRAFTEERDGLIKPSVQSILLLLSRLYLSCNSDSGDVNWRIDEFVCLVSDCAKSRVYHTRELAARALVPLLTVKTVGPFINSLFEVIINGSCHNGNFNLIHGYLLQILEIFKSDLLIGSEVPQMNLTNFITDSEWIFEHLETNNNKPACFPVATVLIKIYHEIIGINKFVDTKVHFEVITQRLLKHINARIILKDRPGREVYESTAASLLIRLLESKLERQETNGRDVDYPRAWESVLSHPNYQVQMIGWSRVIRDVESLGEQFYHRTTRLALESMNSVNDPDLLAIIYEFLYEIFIVFENNFNDHLLLLSESILKIFEKHIKLENESFFRLLGKAFGTQMKYSQDKSDFLANFETTVYEIFCENSWMSSSGNDSRIAIATVIHDIYPEGQTECGVLLNWWTTVLNLLVDDNNQVRKLASVVVSKIPPKSDVKCDSHSLKLFFDKFSNKMKEDKSLLFAAYFAWSLTLADNDYEMDDSDVFNKCHNYEAFEPLRISSLCNEYVNTLLDHYDIQTLFPSDIERWLCHRLSIEPSECRDAQTLIDVYSTRLPQVNNELSNILDPTYNDRLLETLAFKGYKSVFLFLHSQRPD